MFVFLEDALPLVSEADGAQVLVVVDGGCRGAGSAAAGDDDDVRRDDAGGGGLCLLLTAVVGVRVGVAVGGAARVVIEGGVTGAAVEVADPAGWPPVIWAAGHEAGFGWGLGADGHAGHHGILQAAQGAG